MQNDLPQKANPIIEPTAGPAPKVVASVIPPSAAVNGPLTSYQVPKPKITYSNNPQEQLLENGAFKDEAIPAATPPIEVPYRRIWLSVGASLVVLLLIAGGASYWSSKHSTPGNSSKLGSISTQDGNNTLQYSLNSADLKINRDTVISNGKKFSVFGNVAIQNEADSSRAFYIQDAKGDNLFVADTQNKRVGIGEEPNGTAALQVAGDISVKGKIISSDGNISVGSDGIRIGSVLVCTARGCISSSSPAPTPASPTIDVANVAYLNKNQTFTGSLNFGGSINASGGLNTTSLKVNGVSGTSLSCAPNEYIKNPTISSGVITGGVCNPGPGVAVATLQEVYNASTPADFALNSSNGPFGIRDGVSPLGTNLFEVSDNSGANKYFAVNSSGVAVLGNVNTTGQYQVNGTQISSANLSNDSNLAKVNGNTTYTGNNTFSSASNSFSGNGSGLTSVNAAQLNSQNGSYYTNATNLSAGTLSNARLNSNVALTDRDSQVVTGNNQLFQNATNSLTAFQIQNAAGTNNLFVADTINSRIGIGISPATYTLSVGGSINGTTVFQNGNQVCDTSGNCSYSSSSLTDSANLARLDATQTFTGANTFSNASNSFTGNGAGLTSVDAATLGGNAANYYTNASNISSGTLGDGRLSANVALLNANQTASGNKTFTGTVLMQNAADSTAQFQIQNSTGTSNLFVADTTNTRIAIGQAAANYPLDVAGDINSTTGIRVGGTLLCSSGGCLAASGSGSYIQNGTTTQTANLNIRSNAVGNVSGVFEGANGQTADILDVQGFGGATKYLGVNTSGIAVTGNVNTTGQYQVNGTQISSAALSNDSNLAKLNAIQTFTGNNTFTGTVLSKNTADSTTAFQVQNAAGTALWTADTVNQAVNITGNASVGNPMGWGDIQFSDGFESGNTSKWTNNPSDGVTSVQSSVVHNGRYAAYFSHGGSQLGTSISGNNLYARAWVYVSSQTTASADLLYLDNGGNGNSWHVERTTAGQVCVNGSNCSGSLPLNSWHEIELQVITGAGSGSTNLWLDGSSLVALSSQANGTSTIQGIGAGDGSASDVIAMYMDDVVVSTVRNTGSSVLSVGDGLNVQGSTSLNGQLIIHPAVEMNNIVNVQNWAGNNLLNIGTYNGNGYTTLGNQHVIIRTNGDTATAFQVQNSSGSSILSVDTSNRIVGIDGGTTYQTMSYSGGSGFSSYVNYSLGTGDFRGITSADFNGDGKNDIATASWANKVNINLGNGDGTFGTYNQYSTGGDVPDQGIKTADFNGDGKPDIVTANFNNPTISVLLNDGTGAFPSYTSYSTTSSSPRSLAVADFNGDGKPDIAVDNGGSIDVFLNSGSGTFPSKSNYSPPLSSLSVAAADVNGDGKPDLITANNASAGGANGVSVFMNNGNGTFASAVNYTGVAGGKAITAADFNGDGKPDVAVVSNSGNGLDVLFNNGDGTFAIPANYAASSGSGSMTSGDFNGDGKPDIATADDNSQVSVFLNNGNGTFAARSTYTVNAYSYDLVAADFNGDGKPDIASTDQQNNVFSVLINSATTVYTTHNGALSLTTPSAATTGLIIQGALSQTDDLLHIQDSSGTLLAGVTSSGVLEANSIDTTIATTLNLATTTANNVNVGFTGSVFTVNSTLKAIGQSVFSNTATFKASVLAKNTTNSTTAFQIQDAAGNNVFTANSSADAVTVGNTSGATQATSALAVLGNVNSSNDFIQLQNANSSGYEEIVAHDNTGAFQASFGYANALAANLPQSFYIQTNNKDINFSADPAGTTRNLNINGTNGNVTLKNTANSTSAFQVQNAGSGSLVNVDSTNSSISLAGLDSGAVGAWSSAPNVMPANRSGHTSVVVNGYVYVIGGSATSTVYYSKLNADGTDGVWGTTTALPAARYYHSSVTYNGYIYVVGGHNGSTATSTVYYAKPNSDGTISTWRTASNALPAVRYRHSSIVANGYLYVFGGNNGSTSQSTVYYAKINSDGSVGTWTTSANPLPQINDDSAASYANGFVYIIGGYNGGTLSTVYYASLNLDGSTSTWTTSANPLPQAMQDVKPVVSNGYIYALAGDLTAGGSSTTSVYFTKLNTDGTIGAWQTNANALPAAMNTPASAVMYNGNIYVMGYNLSSTKVVYYASTSKVQIGANLDLISVQSGDGSAGGNITANNVTATGNLNILGQANFTQGVGISGNLSVAGQIAIQNSLDSTTAFQIQNAAGTSLLTVDTQNTAINLAANTTLAAGKYLKITGDITANRPTSPTAGTLFYDTTINQLIQYNGSKWVSDRSTATKIVAASNSTQAAKDAADYVATGTNDQTVINNALTAAAGGTVYLEEGTYTLGGAISVPNSTTLTGAGAGTIVTIPNSLNIAINMIANSDTATGTNVKIKNLLIDGNKANQTSGTMIGISLNGMGAGTGTSAREGAKITDVVIKNMRNEGVNLNNSHNNLISGSTFQNETGDGVYVAGNYNTITGNIAQGSYNGFEIANDNNTVTGNTAQGNSQYGFYINAYYSSVTGNTSQGNNEGINLGGGHNTATGNSLTGNVYGIESDSSGNIISGNSVTNSTNLGVLIYGPYNTVSANTVQGNAAQGIWIGDAYNSVTGNDVYSNASYGIYLSGAQGNTVSGNKIHSNSGATDNNGIYIDGTSSKNSITGNDITDTSCTTSCYAININSATATGNYLASNHFLGDGTNVATIHDITSGGNSYSNQPLSENGDASFRNAANSTTAFQIQNAGGTSLLSADTQNSMVNVGNNSVAGATAKLNVFGGLYDSANGYSYNLKVDDTSAAGQGVGGGIGFGGQADSDRTFAVIQGYHESATAADYAGALGFYTRPSAAAALSKVLTLGSNGSATFENSSNSATAFQIQNSSAVSLFTVDTSTNTITLGSASATPVLLVLGNKNTAGDPTCTNGAMYYNSNSNQFRFCQNGGWTGLGSSYSAPSYVTSLPGSPSDGQEIYYIADSANQVIWHLRYKATGPTYHWEYLGGSPMTVYVSTSESATTSAGSSGYVDLTTVGPSVTLPLAGTYRATFGSQVSSSGRSGGAGSSISNYMKLNIGGTLSGPDAQADTQLYSGTGTMNITEQIVQSYQFTATGASTVVKPQYQISAPFGSGSYSGAFSNRYITIIPIAVN